MTTDNLADAPSQLVSPATCVQPKAPPHPDMAVSRPLRLSSIVLAAAGGLATSAAFPDRGWWPLAFVGVALLVWATRGLSAGRSVLVWFVWGLSFFLVHVSWATAAAGSLAGPSLSVLQACLLAVSGWVWAWAGRAPLLAAGAGGRAVLFAAVWVTGEQLRSVWPFGGFPWGRLAFSQTDSSLLGLARLGGAPLISFTVALGGYALVLLVLAAQDRSRRGALQAAGLAAGVMAAGALVPLPTEPETGTLRIGVVQGNVAQDPTSPDRAWMVLDNHVNGTNDLADMKEVSGLDIVVWPENAADIDPRQDQRAADAVNAAARRIDAPILLGAIRYADGGRYNDMIVWDPQRGPLSSYSKQRPAPFGEYIPLRGLIRQFSSEVDRVQVDMIAGREPAVLSLPVTRLARQVPAGTVICYEVAFDNIVRGAITGGAQILIVPTNNASFGWSAQSTQQLAMSRLRAVEHGRATIQASTVGVSAIIAPDGALIERTGLFTAETMMAELPLRTSVTLSDRLGDAPVALAVTVSLAAVAAGIYTHRRRSPHASVEHAHLRREAPDVS